MIFKISCGSESLQLQMASQYGPRIVPSHSAWTILPPARSRQCLSSWPTLCRGKRRQGGEEREWVTEDVSSWERQALLQRSVAQTIPSSPACDASPPPPRAPQNAAGLKYLMGWQCCVNAFLLVFNHAGDSLWLSKHAFAKVILLGSSGWFITLKSKCKTVCTGWEK